MQFSGWLASGLWTLALVSAHQSEHSAQSVEVNQQFSLLDLVSTKKAPSSWNLGESSIYEEGRIRLTPGAKKKGSLWAKKAYPLGSSFTLEWTFRSVGYLGKTEGGLSFWFLSSSGGKSLTEKSFYNGPSQFDGLQLLIDNNGPLSSTLRAQLNDGVQTMTKENVYDNTFASCLLGYQDSSVPSTIRLTYDRENNNLLKLQVDNRVCFQTRKVKLPVGEYYIGATADNANTEESFEILKTTLYDTVIEESLIPNVNAMPQPKVLTKVVDKVTGEESLLEKDVYEAQRDKVTNFELYKKLDKVEGKILANDIHSLEEQLQQLAKTQEELLKYVSQLSQTLQKSGTQSSGSKDEGDSYKDLFSMNEKLEKMLNEQQRIREAAKNSNSTGPHTDEIVSRLAIWILPLIIIMLVMAYYTFRIRQEIVKTKLL